MPEVEGRSLKETTQGEGMNRMKILIADDCTMVRESLRKMLDLQENMTVVGEAKDLEEAIPLGKELGPDVVIVRVYPAELNPVEGIARLLDGSGCKVVVNAFDADARFFQAVMRAGASAFLTRDCPFDELIQAIRIVAEGGVYLTPEISKIVVDDFIFNRPKEPSTLSPRETQVLRLIAEGNRLKEIAAQFRVSVKTVETYRRRMMKKLGVASNVDLVKYAIREGIITL